MLTAADLNLEDWFYSAMADVDAVEFGEVVRATPFKASEVSTLIRAGNNLLDIASSPGEFCEVVADPVLERQFINVCVGFGFAFTIDALKVGHGSNDGSDEGSGDDDSDDQEEADDGDYFRDDEVEKVDDDADDGDCVKLGAV